MPGVNRQTSRSDDDLELEDEIEDVETDESEEGDEEIRHGNGTAARSQSEQGTLLQLLSDPEIASVINAKRAGKKVKVVEEATEDAAKEVVDEEEDEEELPEAERKLLARALKKIDKAVDKRLGTVATRVEGLEALAGSIQQREAKAEVAKAREKYRDFDKYRAPMLKLVKENPGLAAEELYLIAKARAGKLNLTQPSSETERPTNQPRRRPKKRDAESARPASRRQAWNSAMERALGELDLSTLE